MDAVPPKDDMAHPGQTSFVAFIREVKPTLKITKQIRLLAAKVEGPLVRNEGWLRLILVWPPRTGKTTAGSVLLLAWIFGLHPDWEAIVGSLSGKLATKIGAKVRQIIASKAFAKVFTGVQLSKHTASKTEFAVKSIEGVSEGYFFASGRNTRATGQGGKCLFFDDLIGEKEADSAPAIDDAKDAIQMLRSRGAPDGFHWIICNTRYREDDPIGHILDEYKSDGPWDMITLPVIVEDAGEEADYILDDGELWRRRIGDILAFYTADSIKALKDGLLARKPHEWFGQFKGRPRPPSGRKVDGNDVRKYDEPVQAARNLCDRVVVIVDTARKAEEQNDPSGIVVMGQQGQKHRVLHCEARRAPFLDLCVWLARVCLEWKPALVLIEDSANGTALAETLRRQGFAVDMSSGKPVQVPFHTPIELVPCSGNLGSKVMRFDASVPPAVRQGWLWVPRNAPWAEALIEQLVSFPRVQHDEECDCLAMWFKWAAEHGAEMQAPITVPAAVQQAAATPGRRPAHDTWQPIGRSRGW